MFLEDLLSFRDFVSRPTTQEVFLQRVEQSPNLTPGLELIFSRVSWMAMVSYIGDWQVQNMALLAQKP